MAVEGDQVQCVRELLAAGASPRSRRSRSGTTALHIAAAAGSTGSVAALLAAGASVHALDSKNQTALHAAVVGGQAAGAGANCALALAVLIAAGGDVRAADQKQQTALHYAAYQQQSEVVALLLLAGADANAVGEGGMRPLHWAALNGDEASLRTLLLSGADTRARDTGGRSAMAWACNAKRDNVAAVLRRAGERHHDGAQQTLRLCRRAESLLVAGKQLLEAAGGAVADPTAPAPSAPPFNPLAAAAAALELSAAVPAAVVQAPRHECRICFADGTELLAFLPCGHRCACPECTQTLLAGPAQARRCPICRAAVISSLRVFDA